jgi:hypothetical protein
MVEQLEAAAENVELQEFQNDMSRELASLPVHENVQSVYGHYNHHIPGSHSTSQYGCLETKPRFVGDRQQDLFEAVQEENSLNTIDDELRDSQRAHGVDLAPRIASRRTSGDSHRVSNLDEPAYGARSAHHGPFGPLSVSHYTLGNPPSVQMAPPNKDPGPQPVMNDWATVGQGQLSSDHFFSRAQPVLPEAAGTWPQTSSRQQSLEEYIAQIENEVLCRPQDAFDDDYPIPGWHGTQDNHAVFGECVPQAHQSKVDAYDRDLSGDEYFKNRSIGENHYGGGDVMPNSDVDQEEQRFMSTFWRPNRY